MDKLIMGIQWVPIGAWDRESFLQALKTEGAVLRCVVDGRDEFVFPLSSVPLGMTWPQEEPEAWLDLSKKPLDFLKTRFEIPAWCTLRYRLVSREGVAPR